MKVTLYSLLFTLYSLLFTLYSLLFTLKVKKTITLLALLLNVCFCIKPVLAQCPSAQTSGTVEGVNETLVGQSIQNTCAYSMTGLTLTLASGYTSIGTMTLNVYSGNSSCNSGTFLKSGTATSGKTGPFTISLSSLQALAANTTYYLELTGTNNADIRKLVGSGANPYSGGKFYHSHSGTVNCFEYNTDDLRFELVGSTLPIELTDFDVQNTEGSKNNLTWRTASEKNNSHFDIERSTDGTTFHSIGQVKGNNKPSSYQFVDNQPFATTYYRLRQIDFDGTETLSKVVSVELKGKGKGLAVYPNPVLNALNVVYTEGFSFQILNLLGQQVLTGETAAQVDVSALPQGTYILKVGAEQTKFLKQ